MNTSREVHTSQSRKILNYSIRYEKTLLNVIIPHKNLLNNELHQFSKLTFSGTNPTSSSRFQLIHLSFSTPSK